MPDTRPQRSHFFEVVRDCGFELAGVATAGPIADFGYYRQWVSDGRHGLVEYLAGSGERLREDPRQLLPSARTVLCVGKLYKTNDVNDHPVSRYAWGSADYHDLMRRALRRVVRQLRERWGPFDWKICIDTSPVMERAWAREAGLGSHGKNTCLLNEHWGSYFFLGEILVSVALEPDLPPPDRCGTCTRCIDACPTQALTPYEMDARRCVSYHTIELRDAIPEEFRPGQGGRIFGCDICQEVCPWNDRAPTTEEPGFQPVNGAPDLDELSRLTSAEFRARFHRTPVWRSHHHGLLRNVAVAMGNSGDARYRESLERLAHCGDTLVEEHARWALAQLDSSS
jgi:epoxyqueuosine reductase